MDIVGTEVRSRMMSSIRGRDTKPEMLVRKYLHARGMRFRIHRRDLPGKPDLILPRWNVVVFVHGCFWHGHQQCRYFRLPATRADFWRAKIFGNSARDDRAEAKLRTIGWRVFVIWECAIRDDTAKALEVLFNEIQGQCCYLELGSPEGHLEVRAE
jgi:DNA mismatch endonuclease (patch repair protein)